VPGGREYVVGRQYAEGGAPVAGQLAPLFPGIEGLFAEAVRAIAEDVHRVEIRYHATMGYPTSVAIDPRQNVADDELEYRVLGVTAR
jgi:hypothetical protein